MKDDPTLTSQLEEAASRVSAVAKVHEHIQQAIGPDRLDLGVCVTDICRDLNHAVPLCHIEVAAEPSMVNELVTNAAKCAYQGDQGGNI